MEDAACRDHHNFAGGWQALMLIRDAAVFPPIRQASGNLGGDMKIQTLVICSVARPITRGPGKPIVEGVEGEDR